MLTFTNTESSQTSLPSSKVPRLISRPTASITSRSAGATPAYSSPSSNSSSGGHTSHGSLSSVVTSPASASMTMSTSSFPPMGPPSRSARTNAPSSLQKVIMMKDALLDNTEVPILAMWKDESLTIPNRAARALFHPGADLATVKDGFDLVSRWEYVSLHSLSTFTPCPMAGREHVLRDAPIGRIMI